jgi:hypothetical protein
VSGIPTLILLGPDGEVVTAKARDNVMADPSGAGFPWAPKPFSAILGADGSGSSPFITKELDSVDREDVLSRPHLFFYFSAHWFVVLLYRCCAVCCSACCACCLLCCLLYCLLCMLSAAPPAVPPAPPAVSVCCSACCSACCRCCQKSVAIHVLCVGCIADGGWQVPAVP